MRPLPRVLAYLDADVVAMADFGTRAAAIAAAGSGMAMVARLPAGQGRTLHELTTRLLSLARPPMAQVMVSTRADVAMAAGADGVIGSSTSLPVADLRRVVSECGGGCPVLAPVHRFDEAAAAVEAGASALVVGTVWPSTSHPGRPGGGLELISETAALGVPVYAIGGVTTGRAADAVRAGAWGVAAISALWRAGSPYTAAREMLDSTASGSTDPAHLPTKE